MPDLQTLGLQAFALPSAANLLACVMVSIIGFAAFRYGRKVKSRNPVVIGVALMFYPYFVSQTWLIYVIGIALCVALYVFRQPS